MSPGTRKIIVTVGTGPTSFKESLDWAYSDLMYDIKVLKMINDKLPRALDTYAESDEKVISERIRNLDEEGKKQLKLLEEIAKDVPAGTSVEITHQKAVEIVSMRGDTGILESRIPMFIREMSLVYLVSAFESFLEDILTIILSIKPEIQKSIKKMIGYEDIEACTKVEEVRDILVEKAVNSIIGHRDNKDIITSLKDQPFRLELTNTRRGSDWKLLKEAYHRRHIVIHNNCFPDSKYKTETGYKGENKRLSVDKQYLEQSFMTFERCSELIRDAAYSKFA